VLGDGGPISINEFANKYKFSCEGLSPKHVKVLKDISLEEINKFFAPIVNSNGYNYEFVKDPLFIENIKPLCCNLNLRLATKAKACEGAG
jgi:hypothetical protein